MEAFQLAKIGSFVLPIVVPIFALVILPWPRREVARAIVAIVLAWGMWILFTALVYNPSGIAAAQEQGIDSPVMKFDNNTVASALAGGWILPTMTVFIFFVGRSAWRRLKKAKSNN